MAQPNKENLSKVSQKYMQHNVTNNFRKIGLRPFYLAFLCPTCLRMTSHIVIWMLCVINIIKLSVMRQIKERTFHNLFLDKGRKKGHTLLIHDVNGGEG